MSNLLDIFFQIYCENLLVSWQVTHKYLRSIFFHIVYLPKDSWNSFWGTFYMFYIGNFEFQQDLVFHKMSKLVINLFFSIDWFPTTISYQGSK